MLDEVVIPSKQFDDHEDIQIWKRFLAGDTNAYALLYTRYSPLLFRYGRKIIRDLDLIKDCLHDLFVELWKNREKLQIPQSVKNYLLKAFRNKLIRHYKKNFKIVHLNEGVLENGLGSMHSTEEQMIHDQIETDLNIRVRLLLKKLSTQQKEVIFLIYYCNLSSVDVASLMSLSVRTIYNTTYTAIQNLRKGIIEP